MTTAGIAATRPTAVARSASAIPGATTARLVVCFSAMPMKLFMMPQTVPNSPIKGAVAPIVARTLMPRVMLRVTAASWRWKRETTRSLIPSGSLRASLDKRSSASASRTSGVNARFPSSAASRSERSETSWSWTCRSAALALRSSRSLATKIVQVATDAIARPIITSFTSQSDCQNMPLTERLTGRAGAAARPALAQPDDAMTSAPAIYPNFTCMNPSSTRSPNCCCESFAQRDIHCK